MNKSDWRTKRKLMAAALLLLLLSIAGCGSGLSALSSGSVAPPIVANGWTNGDQPTDLEGSIIVLEMFATW